MLRTFKEWSDDGYKIIKGSRSCGKNEKGQHLFSDKQVVKTFKLNSGGGDPREGDDDDEATWDDFEDWGMSPMDFGDN